MFNRYSALIVSIAVVGAAFGGSVGWYYGNARGVNMGIMEGFKVTTEKFFEYCSQEGGPHRIVWDEGGKDILCAPTPVVQQQSEKELESRT